ncbi:mitochondrial import inner membrane translocase subunit Tim29 [Macrosteles quadrilineatus]|uniref:mitochondrial import inner membrane translocase subunit Tim29 n=1 Tax=Macrosteles quadrilineatus TaxID=74068 RepID=UPI0023E35193|nr:mitochondrial import inner membrane translocase subunit Tim29 [Macrosteles quadrilineatus]
MAIWSSIIHNNSNPSKMVSNFRKYYLNKKGRSLRMSTTATEPKKAPLLEKWKRYWQDLATDYYEVLKDTVENGRKNPKQSALLLMCSAAAFTCLKTNPDEIDYRENVLKCCNEVLLIGKPIRNKTTEEYLISMETFYNFGVVRRMSFGLFSVVWIDNFSNELGVYKANCSYLKPQYLTFLNRVVDIGFLGRWWKLNSVMKDYDINAEEWTNSSKVDESTKE